MKDKQLAEEIVKILDKYNKDESYGIPELMNLFKAQRQELKKKVEGMKMKTGFSPGELCFNVDNQEKEYQVYVYNQALDDIINLLEERKE